MKTFRLSLLLLALGSLVLGSCSKDEDPAYIDLGYSYFPTDVGTWAEYTVDSLSVRRQPGDTDTVAISYVLREALVENITDAQGRPAQRVIRYTKDNNGSWLPKDVWSQTRDNERAERTEENQRRLKLLFPPKSTYEWNTNVTNNNAEFELEYQEIDQPWSVNGMTFDSTVLVVSTYPNNPFFIKIYKERYAKHVGLVYREVDSSQTQTNRYERFRTVQVITAHGN